MNDTEPHDDETGDDPIDAGLLAFFGERDEASDEPPPEVPRELGDYRIVREVGRGGMGVVYLAEQVSLRRRVALKVLPAHLTLLPEAIARFRSEASSAARLKHPGIVEVHAVGDLDGHHFIAMEFIEGTPLHEVLAVLRSRRAEQADGSSFAGAVAEGLARGSPVAADASSGTTRAWPRSYVETVCRLVAQVADALQHAHDAGVIHRDVKPSNILVREDGAAVLTDFGLARQEDLPSMTQTGVFAGTPHYASPEQASADKTQIDHRTDVFSLGATLYELLTLHHPFRGKSSQEVLDNIRRLDPRHPRRLNRRVPTDLDTIVMKALEKEPRRRYQSAVELAADLRAFLAMEPIAARSATVATKVGKFARRHRLGSAAAVAAVVVLTAAAWWWWSRPGVITILSPGGDATLYVQAVGPDGMTLEPPDGLDGMTEKHSVGRDGVTLKLPRGWYWFRLEQLLARRFSRWRSELVRPGGGRPTLEMLGLAGVVAKMRAAEPDAQQWFDQIPEWLASDLSEILGEDIETLTGMLARDEVQDVEKLVRQIEVLDCDRLFGDRDERFRERAQELLDRAGDQRVRIDKRLAALRATLGTADAPTASLLDAWKSTQSSDGEFAGHPFTYALEARDSAREDLVEFLTRKSSLALLTLEQVQARRTLLIEVEARNSFRTVYDEELKERELDSWLKQARSAQDVKDVSRAVWGMRRIAPDHEKTEMAKSLLKEMEGREKDAREAEDVLATAVGRFRTSSPDDLQGWIAEVGDGTAGAEVREKLEDACSFLVDCEAIRDTGDDVQRGEVLRAQLDVRRLSDDFSSAGEALVRELDGLLAGRRRALHQCERIRDFCDALRLSEAEGEFLELLQLGVMGFEHRIEKARVRIARLHEEERDWQEQRALLKERGQSFLAELQRRDLQAARGSLAVLEEGWWAAVQRLTRVIQGDASNTDARIELARLRLLGGDAWSAREDALRAVAERPDSSEGWLVLGQAEYMLWGGGENRFARAIKLDDQLARAYYWRGTCRRDRGVKQNDLGALQQASHDLSRAVALGFRSADAYWQMAVIKKDMLPSQPDEREARGVKVVELAQMALSEGFLGDEILAGLGGHHNAVRPEVIDRFKRDIYLVLGRGQIAAKAYSGSDGNLTSALDLDEDCSLGYLLRGVARFWLGRYQEADKDLTRARTHSADLSADDRVLLQEWFDACKRKL